MQRALTRFFMVAFLLAPPATLWAQQQPPPARSVSSAGGSFLQPGDRIILSVDGEQRWTDTFIVKPGPVIDLPTIGPVPLAGVMRGDVQSYLATQIARYVKSPIVRATPLVRVSILGEVARPGYYDLTPDAPLADAISSAGGPTQNAAMTKVRLNRAGVTIQRGNPLQTAVNRGATMSELGMEGGDELIIPRLADTERTVRIISVAVGVPLAILTLMLFRPR